MSTTLTLSAMVVFGWVFSAPGDSLLQVPPELAPPTSSLPLPPIQEKSKATQQKSTSRSTLKDAQQRSKRRNQAQSSAGSSRQYQQDADMPPMMPIPPTESSADAQAGQYYQWLPPTVSSGSSSGATSGGRAASMFGPRGVPNSPTRARPDMSQSYSSMQTAQQQTRRLAAARNAAAVSPQLTPKPFTGYQSTSSGVSPYLNLFRSGNALGTIDNYTTLVKPQLDQGRTNQQFGADIHGLENSNRVQGLNILRLDRDTQNLQGVSANQYFMNYGDYYPNAGR